MIGIKFLVLCLKALEVLSSDCAGWGCSPWYIKPQIVGGSIITPDEYSWIASLQYAKQPRFGICAGSVINSWNVLTAAHCITGDIEKRHDKPIGVRLGNYTLSPYCDYGTANCTSFLYFEISQIRVHEDFTIDNGVLVNDIALIRLDKPIPFNEVLMPVCLPNRNGDDPVVGEMLTVAGWGSSEVDTLVAKRAVAVPLLNDSNLCAYESETRICAGVITNNLNTAKVTCDGDSGGPLMKEDDNHKMTIVGIVSFSRSNCVTKFFAPHFTKVRPYLNWIRRHVTPHVNKHCIEI